MTRRFERYVAIGDSSTEGLDDPDGRGGYRGWADRFAERIAAAQGSLLYANLAVRGHKTRRVREEQLDAALALRPDVATAFSGMNDLIRPGFDADAVGRDVEHIQRTLVRSGAVVLTLTLPDLARIIPFGGRLTPRIRAFNAVLRSVAASTGAVLVDLGAHEVAGDPQMWSTDRLHANAAGHQRIAAALSHALGLPGADDGWTRPLPPREPLALPERIAFELRWCRTYLLPWVMRRLRGRSSGDGRRAKRPELLPVA